VRQCLSGPVYTKELEECETAIRAGEQRVNALVFVLYGLTDAERKLVVDDPGVMPAS
jgi:hypothetical protein